ncbi:hypothetical protein AMTRI_Chr05g66010 [Amborella trichopoda]
MVTIYNLCNDLHSSNLLFFNNPTKNIYLFNTIFELMPMLISLPKLRGFGNLKRLSNGDFLESREERDEQELYWGLRFSGGEGTPRTNRGEQPMFKIGFSRERKEGFLACLPLLFHLGRESIWTLYGV